MPLVIVLHGGGGTGESMIRLTRGEFNTLADKEGFVVVYPDGVTSNRPIKRHWNDGRDRRFSQSDDIGFISALIDYLAQTLNIDRRRVYATGISNGAQMCMRLARELSDKIAAFAPVAYAMPEKFTSLPISARPISVLIITGTTDPLLPWKGGETRDPGRTRRLGKILSVRASARAFAKFDSCSLTPEVSFESPKNTPDGTKVLKEVYRQGKDGSTVILYAIENGGHGWPGGLQYLPEAFVGKTSKQIDACEVIWEFFKANGQ